MEVTNRLKELDLIDRVPEELWTEVHNIVQEAVIKITPNKKMQKGKMVVWGGFIDSKEEKQKKREKGKI